MRASFDVRIGESTDLAATIHFARNDDICGEGYEGYDYTIVFDNPLFNSRLWIFDEVPSSSEEEAINNATEIYNLIADFIKAVRS
jgi:hypothetical protein